MLAMHQTGVPSPPETAMNAILAANSSSPTVATEPSAVRPQDSTQVRPDSDDDWEQDYLAQVALAEQRERIFSSSYLPASAGRFLIH
jgi:hypothetical protein